MDYALLGSTLALDEGLHVEDIQYAACVLRLWARSVKTDVTFRFRLAVHRVCRATRVLQKAWRAYVSRRDLALESEFKKLRIPKTSILTRESFSTALRQHLDDIEAEFGDLAGLDPAKIDHRCQLTQTDTNMIMEVIMRLFLAKRRKHWMSERLASHRKSIKVTLDEGVQVERRDFRALSLKNFRVVNETFVAYYEAVRQNDSAEMFKEFQSTVLGSSTVAQGLGGRARRGSRRGSSFTWSSPLGSEKRRQSFVAFSDEAEVATTTVDEDNTACGASLEKTASFGSFSRLSEAKQVTPIDYEKMHTTGVREEKMLWTNDVELFRRVRTARRQVVEARLAAATTTSSSVGRRQSFSAGKREARRPTLSVTLGGTISLSGTTTATPTPRSAIVANEICDDSQSKSSAPTNRRRSVAANIIASPRRSSADSRGGKRGKASGSKLRRRSLVLHPNLLAAPEVPATPRGVANEAKLHYQVYTSDRKFGLTRKAKKRWDDDGQSISESEADDQAEATGPNKDDYVAALELTAPIRTSSDHNVRCSVHREGDEIVTTTVSEGATLTVYEGRQVLVPKVEIKPLGAGSGSDDGSPDKSRHAHRDEHAEVWRAVHLFGEEVGMMEARMCKFDQMPPQIIVTKVKQEDNRRAFTGGKKYAGIDTRLRKRHGLVGPTRRTEKDTDVRKVSHRIQLSLEPSMSSGSYTSYDAIGTRVTEKKRKGKSQNDRPADTPTAQTNSLQLLGQRATQETRAPRKSIMASMAMSRRPSGRMSEEFVSVSGFKGKRPASTTGSPRPHQQDCSRPASALSDNIARGNAAYCRRRVQMQRAAYRRRSTHDAMMQSDLAAQLSELQACNVSTSATRRFPSGVQDSIPLQETGSPLRRGKCCAAATCGCDQEPFTVENRHDARGPGVVNVKFDNDNVQHAEDIRITVNDLSPAEMSSVAHNTTQPHFHRFRLLLAERTKAGPNAVRKCGVKDSVIDVNVDDTNSSRGLYGIGAGTVGAGTGTAFGLSAKQREAKYLFDEGVRYAAGFESELDRMKERSREGSEKQREWERVASPSSAQEKQTYQRSSFHESWRSYIRTATSGSVGTLSSVASIPLPETKEDALAKIKLLDAPAIYTT